MDGRLSCSSVRRILQASMLEWLAIPFSRGSSWLRDQTQVSNIAGEFLTVWVTKEAQEYWSRYPVPSPADLPDPQLKPGFPALQADSLLAELPGKPMWYDQCHMKTTERSHKCQKPTEKLPQGQPAMGWELAQQFFLYNGTRHTNQ